MGQRLVIRLFDDKQDIWDEELAPLLSIYYHWSADIEEALPVLKGIAKGLESNSLEGFIQALSYTEARLISEDSQFVRNVPHLQSILPSSTTPLDRNEGLITVSEEKSEEYYNLAQATVDIYLAEQEFDFYQFLEMGTILDEDHPDELPEIFQSLPFVPFNVESIDALEKFSQSHPQYFNI